MTRSRECVGCGQPTVETVRGRFGDVEGAMCPDCQYSIRWRSEERTPTHPELVGWDKPYRSIVFLTLSARKPILGVAKAPWVRREDRDVTYRRAFEVLAQPGSLV